MREQSDKSDKPAEHLSSRPLWFWNGALDANEIRSQVAATKNAGYAGFGIVASRDVAPAFTTDEYLEAFAIAVESAADHELAVCFYDDFWFPTGTAGGALADRHPEALSKRLDLHAIDISGEAMYSKPLPVGHLMAAVAMNTETLERIDLRTFIADGWLNWKVHRGRWRVMLFTCVTDGAKGLVDYLDPGSVRTFLELAYDRFYNRLHPYFGNTIDMAFHDETTMHWVEGGRAWTPRFNELFAEHYGFEPGLLYPALWFDIGPETTAARCLLFGFRSELYSTSLIRQLNEWCADHHIRLTGHVDQEEVANPTGLCGDLMKIFQHQDIPGVDQIFYHGRAKMAAKIVSSAARNFDRPLVMCECYGVVEGIDVTGLYREAIDLFARGCNLLMPHAMWYRADPKNYPPDLSPHDSQFGPHLEQYNAWTARIQSVLQTGRSVADIAVLYPIDSLHAEYRFDAGGDPYLGGLTDSRSDYLELGEMLVSDIRRDFTFVHPDVLASKVHVAFDEQGKPVLSIDNDGNRESWRVVVIPDGTTVSVSALQVIKAFHDAGGVVISTGRLPQQSREIGSDDAVVKIINELFGADGHATTIGPLTAAALRAALDQALPIPDTRIETSAGERTGDPNIAPGDLAADTAAGGDGAKAVAWSGCVSYLHKETGGTNRWFIGNSTDSKVDLKITLRGAYRLSVLDPQTGESHDLATRLRSDGGVAVTEFDLTLAPVQALIVTGPE